MRVVGILLIVLGVLALAVPSVTFFTTERVVDAGFFAIDVKRPHTVVLNPAVGVVAALAGVAMLFAGKRQAVRGRPHRVGAESIGRPRHGPPDALQVVRGHLDPDDRRRHPGGTPTFDAAKAVLDSAPLSRDAIGSERYRAGLNARLCEQA